MCGEINTVENMEKPSDEQIAVTIFQTGTSYHC